MTAWSTLDIENEEQLVHYLRFLRLITASETRSINVLYGGVSNRMVLVSEQVGLVLKSTT